MATKKRATKNPKRSKARKDSQIDVQKYAPFIKRIASRYAPYFFTEEELESLAWEGSLRAVDSYNRRKGTTLQTWIFTKANGAIKDALQKEQVRREREIQGSLTIFETYRVKDEISDIEIDEQRKDCEQRKDFVIKALAMIDERTRDIITRHFYEGQTQAQIAAAIGISQSWCSRLYKRGMAQLKIEFLKLQAR